VVEVAEGQEEALQKIERVHHIQNVEILFQLGEHQPHLAILVLQDHVLG